VQRLADAAPKLWKADIDSAYRRIPIAECDRWCAWVAIKTHGRMFVARHVGTCFGAIGSVHAWNRVGEMIAHFARTLLMLPVLRYVDDYFSADREDLADHGMMCFDRLVKALMGPTASWLCLTTFLISVVFSISGPNSVHKTDFRLALKWQSG